MKPCGIGGRRELERKVAWTNFVHSAFHDEPSSPTRELRRDLPLAMPEDRLITRKEIRLLTPEIAERSARSGDKTMSRDLNRLVQLRLLATGAECDIAQTSR